MKTPYLTRESIRETACGYLQTLEREMRISPGKLVPGEAGLMVIDMQRYFLEPESHAFLPAAPAIIPGIRELVRLFRAAGRPVVFTRHLNTDQDAGMLGRWWQDTIRRESPFSELSPELDSSDCLVLEKSQYDAFHRTRLQEILQEQGVRQLVITGVMTHLCCETTARAAFVRGFEPFFPVDGSATSNEIIHSGTLRSLGHGFARLQTVEDLIAVLEEGT